MEPIRVKIQNTDKDVELQKLIADLSKNLIRDTQTCVPYFERLIDIYSTEEEDGICKEYRHSYSDLTTFILGISEKDSDAITSLIENLQYLISYAENVCDSIDKNLSKITEGIKSEDFAIFKKQPLSIISNIYKLKDHILLEQIRIGDVYKRYEIKANEARDIADKASKKYMEAIKLHESSTEQAEKAIEDSKSLKTEVVSVLGIFSAVVLAFIGEIAFTTSVFQNLHSSSIYRILIATILIGLVTANVIYGLFYYIHSIVRKQEETKLKPILIINIILLLLLALTVAAWFFGTVEWRNNRF